MATVSLDWSIGSPEEIHRALRIVRRRNWIVPIVLSGIVLWTLGFLLLGRIPVTAKGNAIFLTRGTIVPFQSNATGQVGDWRLNVGDMVNKGDLLGLLEQPLIEKELEQARAQFADLEERNQVIRSLTKRFTDLESEGFERKRTTLTDRISILAQQVKSSAELGKQAHDQKLLSMKKNGDNLTSLLALEKQRYGELDDKLKRTLQLQNQGFRTVDDVLQSRQALTDQKSRLDELQLQLLQQDLLNLQVEETYLQALDRITEREDAVADLQEELRELENRQLELEKTNLEAEYSRQVEENELKRAIERAEKQVTENREIRSEYSGQLLELTVSKGRLVTRGQRLGAMDTRTAASVLEAVVYFKLEDGKKIKPGMKLRLTPATVKQERFGSLLARVVSVSTYPVTTEGVANVVGNSTVATTLTKENHQIEVVAELLRSDSPSGYQWDLSAGPEIKVTSGTIASALVNIEEMPPISFVVPVLRDWSGF